jgi:5-bromo-4-chloroindolyl phosphate hydrolysis protein
MTDFLKQDVFFFLTSILVVVITIVMVIAGYYIVKITKAINYISQKAKNESDLIAEDLSDLRENVKEQGLKVKHLASFFSSIYNRNNKKAKK